MINSSRSTRHWNFYQVIYNLINKPAQKWISILRNNITNNKKKKKTNLLLYISIYPPCLSLKLWKYNSKYNTKFIKNFLAPLHAYTSSLKKTKKLKIRSSKQSITYGHFQTVYPFGRSFHEYVSSERRVPRLYRR